MHTKAGKETFMYKRLELHNHTTESDSSLTCEALLDHMLADGVDAFALTDHNTISGHPKMQALLAQRKAPIDCIYGMEYTTYYGHILCLNLTEYVPWENINRHKPELLFEAAKEKGALAGIAHPYSFGEPFARGCRFEMTVTDYSSVDFIEIFNDPEPLHMVNEPAVKLWESLVLQGHWLAATSGMDLHGKNSFDDQYATFIEGEPGGDIAAEIRTAIKSCRTWVSRGPLLFAEYNPEKDCLEFRMEKTSKPGFSYPDSYLVICKTASESITLSLDSDGRAILPLSQLKGASIIIPELYGKDSSIEELFCVSPVIRLDDACQC